MGMAFFTVEGYFNLEFPSFSFFWKERILHLFGATGFIALIQLVRRLLNVSKNVPLADYALRGLAFVNAFIALASLFGDQPLYSVISQAASAATVIVCLLTGAFCLNKTPIAPFFILSSFSFLGGTLLFVGHDLEPLRTPHDGHGHGDGNGPGSGHGTGRPFDPDAYVRLEDFADVLGETDGWVVEAQEKRPRPPGSATAHHHVDDLVLRARRTA